MTEPRFFYDLDGQPITHERWLAIAATGTRFVGMDTVGELVVGTWWLGIDHSFGEAPTPLIFETVVWELYEGGAGADPPEEKIVHAYDRWYASREDARDGHVLTLQLVQHAQEHQ